MKRSDIVWALIAAGLGWFFFVLYQNDPTPKHFPAYVTFVGASLFVWSVKVLTTGLWRGARWLLERGSSGPR